MLDLLYCGEWHAPIEGEEAKWKNFNRQVVSFIRQWVDDNVYHHIENETSAHTFWKKLEESYKMEHMKRECRNPKKEKKQEKGKEKQNYKLRDHDYYFRWKY